MPWSFCKSVFAVRFRTTSEVGRWEWSTDVILFSARSRSFKLLRPEEKGASDVKLLPLQKSSLRHGKFEPGNGSVFVCLWSMQ